MSPDGIATYVRGLVFPQPVDIEEAQRVILEHLSQLGPGKMEQTQGYTGLIGLVERSLYMEPFPPYNATVEIVPPLHKIKAELVAREAIQLLQERGAIVAVGENATITSTVVSPTFTIPHHSSGNLIPDIQLPQPVVFWAYRIATGFAGQHFRLASSHLYLSHLDVAHLPSRAKRCLEESIDAFRHGLYLSAVMNAGAASEGIWMDLGRLIATKVSVPALTKAVNEPRVFISTVIQEAQKALENQCAMQKSDVFKVASEWTSFKEQEARLRERRNYAMHSGDASSDEHLFTYNETGLLLLDAADYFRKLVELYAAIEAIV